MIKETITKRIYVCDICKKEVSQNLVKVYRNLVKNCNICKKDLCVYCSLRLVKVVRKYPDSGYILLQKIMGHLCFKCAKIKG